MSLEQLDAGERGEIIEVKHCGGCGGGCHHHEHHENNHGRHTHRATGTRAEEMGLRVGKMVEVLKKEGNLLLLLVDEAHIAIDRKIARNIRVTGVAA